MFICRLFHRDRPFEQIEARLLADGAITVGRDPNADWPLPDPEATLSRLHCTLTVESDRLYLRDTSTNGTLVEGEPVVAPDRGALVREAGPMKRRVEKVARGVAGEDAAGAVAAVRGGSEAHHEQARLRVAETGHRPGPVGLVPITGDFHSSGLRAPAAKPWALLATHDVVTNSGKRIRFHRANVSRRERGRATRLI